METLTLTLHKAKTTKNKVVYGTQDGSVIQSVYIGPGVTRNGASGEHHSSHLVRVNL